MSCCCKRAKNYLKKCPLCTVFIRWRFAIEIKTDFFLYQGVNMFISTAGTLTWASWALTCGISLKWPFKELVFGTEFPSLLTPELLTWFIRTNIHVTYKQVSHPDCKQIEFIHSLPMAVIQYLCRRANMQR